MLVAQAAQAETVLERYEAPPPGSPALVGPGAAVNATQSFALGARISYADTVMRVRVGTEQEVLDVVKTAVSLHLQAAWTPLSNVAFDVSQPLVYQRGNAAIAAIDGLKDVTGLALADSRLGATLGIVPPAWRSSFTVALRPELWLPTGDAERLAGANRVRYALSILVSQRCDLFDWQLGFGRRRGGKRGQLDGALGTETTGFAALHWNPGAVSLGPELWGAVADDSRSNFRLVTRLNLEAMLAARWFGSGFVVSAGVGPGLSEGLGTPAFRAVLGVEVTWPGPKTSTAAGGATSTPPASVPPSIKPAVPVATVSAGPLAGADGVTAANLKAPVPASTTPQTLPASTDDCPPETEHAGTAPGCRGLVQVEQSQLSILRQVTFESGLDALTDDGKLVLQEVADAINQHPEIVRVAVDGHTDNVGREVDNLRLSRQRAVVVIRWLIQHGVDERRLEARGFGARRPIAEVDTPAGRTKNRRVEFQILKRSQTGVKKEWRDGALAD
jgi:OmpA-OmpF porin, OOP family